MPVKRIRSLISASTSAAFANRITQCFTAPNEEILFLQHFDTAFHRHTLFPSIRSQAYQWTTDLQDMSPRTETSSHCFVRPSAPNIATSAIIRHILASRSDQPNAFGEKIPVPTALNVHMWDHLLRHYDDKIVAEFLKYGWPINYSSHQLPLSTSHNHPSALTFADHVRHYIKTELSFGAIAGTLFGQPTQQASRLLSTANSSKTRFVKTPSRHGLEFSPRPFCKQRNSFAHLSGFPVQSSSSRNR